MSDDQPVVSAVSQASSGPEGHSALLTSSSRTTDEMDHIIAGELETSMTQENEKSRSNANTTGLFLY